MKNYRFILICALLVLGMYGCVSAVYQNIHVRYRLTVEVAVGDQIKTGSGVIDVSYEIYPDSLVNFDGPNSHTRVVGYAITVDLAEKGLLFLTFANAGRTPADWRERNDKVFCGLDDIGCLPFAAYGRSVQVRGTNYSDERTALSKLREQNGPRDVPFAALPKLVHFLDLNDPNTLAPVSPKDLAASFGPGVKLNRVVLELTGDPVTPAPEIWPQWLTVKRQNTIFRGYENG